MTSPSIRMDEKYYMRCAIFLVEDTYFKVPTMALEAASEVFKTMFTLPTPPGKQVEGESDDKPIRLMGVKKDEFRSLVQLLYPCPPLEKVQLSLNEWLNVLALSKKWQMDRIRTEAIEQIYKSQKAFPHTLFTLGKEHDIDEWIFVGVKSFVLRAQPLDADDVKSIGIDEVLKIASIRECFSQSHSNRDRKGQLRSGPMERLEERIKTDYGLSRGLEI